MIQRGEDHYLPISGLQHLLFCKRQCALIHLEQIWLENRLTVEGRHLHEKVDIAGVDVKPNVRVVRALPLRSDALQLVGRADLVEFHHADDSCGDGDSVPYPVEYKRGRRGRWDHDEVQLCAQAMALEEMMDVTVPRGAIFYAASRRRIEVEFNGKLRQLTIDTAREFHELMSAQITPRAVFAPKCQSCSLQPICMPNVTGEIDRSRRYLDNMLIESGSPSS